MKSKIKSVLKCSKCLLVWDNIESKTKMKCPNCGNMKDARIGRKPPEFYERMKQYKKPKSSTISRRLLAMGRIGKGIVECENCGCDKPKIIEINHIDGGGTKEIKNVGSPNQFYNDIISGKKNIDDLNLLCKVCNILDHIIRKFGKLPYEIIYNK